MGVAKNNLETMLVRCKVHGFSLNYVYKSYSYRKYKGYYYGKYVSITFIYSEWECIFTRFYLLKIFGRENIDYILWKTTLSNIQLMWNILKHVKHQIIKPGLPDFLELLRDDAEAVYCMLRILFTYAIHAFFRNTEVINPYKQTTCIVMYITKNLGNPFERKLFLAF